MTLADRISTDHQIFDDTRHVAIVLKRSTGTDYIEIDHALRTGLTRAEMLAAAAWLTGDEVVWSIPHLELTASDECHEIRQGDTITDCSDTWTVVAVEHRTLSARWRCVAVKQK